VLDLSLFNRSDDLTQSRLRKVLELLGVKSLYPVHILRHHIIPRFKTVSPPLDVIFCWLLLGCFRAWCAVKLRVLHYWVVSVG